MKYYILAVMEQGELVCAFGDYDRESVMFEKDAEYRGVKSRIVCINGMWADSQRAVDDAIKALNSRG